MPYVSAEAFLERIDPVWSAQLTAASGSDEVDATRVARALEDASAELDGWLLRLPAGMRPPEATLLIHCTKVALYLLTLNRPGPEVESIRKAYEDVVAYYVALLNAAASSTSAPSGGAGCSPPGEFSRPGAFGGFGVRR